MSSSINIYNSSEFLIKTGDKNPAGVCYVFEWEKWDISNRIPDSIRNREYIYKITFKFIPMAQIGSVHYKQWLTTK